MACRNIHVTHKLLVFGVLSVFNYNAVFSGVYTYYRNDIQIYGVKNKR